MRSKAYGKGNHIAGKICYMGAGRDRLLAGGSDCKPYDEALRRAPQLKEELRGLPYTLVCHITPLLTYRMSADDLHEAIVLYYDLRQSYSGNRLKGRLEKKYEALCREKRRSDWLNSSKRNISLDECLEKGSRPVADWLNLEEHII